MWFLYLLRSSNIFFFRFTQTPVYFVKFRDAFIRTVQVYTKEIYSFSAQVNELLNCTLW